ncbi:MAG: flagellar M-ring protein FliF [Mucispirillum sp.]|nr:flagellar M-ring protein FliF [Mucispirillum sp.]
MAVRKLSTQFLDIWAKLTSLQRVSIIAATVAVIASVTVLLVWANKPAYKTLYTDMAQDDIQQVSDQLRKDSVPFRVNGNTVEVPQENVYSARMMLAEQGLPKTKSTGFELFDKSSFGKTEFMQNVDYQRALQGELSNTIAAMDKVVEARVHLTVPKERLFVSEEELAKASVALKLAPNAVLTEDEIRSISHLVSAAVKGLTPQNIQIVDTAGNLLSDFMTEANEPYRLTQNQISYERDQEKYLEDRLKNALLVMLGPDNPFIVKVSVEMDFSQREIVSEKFGETPVVRSQRTLEINSRQTGKGPQGIPGVESNLAEPDILVDGIVSEYSKTDETQNFEIDKTVTRENKVGGEIKRLTVAVVVDDKLAIEDVNGIRQAVRRPRTEDELTKLRESVAAASGVNIERGDVVNVTNISFDTTKDEIDLMAEERAKRMEMIKMGASYASAVIILLLFYLLILRPILKRLDKAREIDEEMLGESALDAQMAGLDISVGDESGFPKSVEELEREIEAELEESTPIDVEAVKSKVMLKKIEEQANEDPEMIANLVKAMIRGGNSGGN